MRASRASRRSVPLDVDGYGRFHGTRRAGERTRSPGAQCSAAIFSAQLLAPLVGRGRLLSDRGGPLVRGGYCQGRFHVHSGVFSAAAVFEAIFRRAATRPAALLLHPGSAGFSFSLDSGAVPDPAEAVAKRSALLLPGRRDDLRIYLL